MFQYWPLWVLNLWFPCQPPTHVIILWLILHSNLQKSPALKSLWKGQMEMSPKSRIYCPRQWICAPHDQRGQTQQDLRSGSDERHIALVWTEEVGICRCALQTVTSPLNRISSGKTLNYLRLSPTAACRTTSSEVWKHTSFLRTFPPTLRTLRGSARQTLTTGVSGITVRMTAA